MGETVVLLHGAGQSTRSWDGVVDALPPEVRGVPLPVEAPEGERFSLDGAVRRLTAELDERGLDSVHVCGLSLGAMVALPLARDAPERVRSLTLSGGQVRPPRALMALQTGILRILPRGVFASSGADKQTMIQQFSTVSSLDMRDALPRISARTLVLCGSRDVANRAAAHALATGIPEARLTIVPGVGHEWNVSHPTEFARILGDFVRGSSRE